MSSEVDFDSDLGFVDATLDWALETGVWNGRPVSSQDASEFSDEVAFRIANLLFSQNPEGLDFNQMAVQFARLGTTDAESLTLLEKDIAELKITPDGMVVQAGFGKWLSKCWKKHKAAILIGIGIAAVAVTVVVVAACTAGAAAGAIAGGLAAGGKTKDDDAPSKPAPVPQSPNAIPPQNVSQSLSIPQETLSSMVPSSLPITASTPWTFLDNGVRIGEQVVPYTSFVEQMQREGIMPRPSPNHPEPSWLTQVLTKKTPWGTEVMPLTQETQPSWVTKPLPNQSPATSRQEPSPVPNGEPSWFTRAMFPRELWDDKITSDRRVFTPVALPVIGQKGQKIVHTYCGIANDQTSVMEGGTYLHKQLGGKFAVQPNWVHQESLPYGLAMVALEKTFADPTPADVLQWGGLVFLRNLVMSHSDVQHSIDFVVNEISTNAQKILEQKNPRLKQVAVTFSNGGYVYQEALKRVPPEYRQTVIAITTGSTAIIDANLAFKTYNVIGDKDWPSKFCNGGESGIEEAKKTAKVEMIEQTETEPGIGGHYFIQSDYQKRVADILMEDIFPNYETR